MENSNFSNWIACKIAGTSTSLSVNRKFLLSDFEVLRVGCIVKDRWKMPHDAMILRSLDNIKPEMALALPTG